MFESAISSLSKVSIHAIGNPIAGEELILSEEQIDINNELLNSELKKYFLSAFRIPEFFSFISLSEQHNNEGVFGLVQQIFDDPDTFHNTGKKIAEFLYDNVTIPEIKSGDLYLAYFPSLVMEDEETDAIGIYKVETKHSFLKLQKNAKEFSLFIEQGLPFDKPDRACMILNTEKEAGYKVCLLERNKGVESSFWKDEFLNLKPYVDGFYHTKQFMNLTKEYVTKQLPDEFSVEKADQIGLLNRSVSFFKENESFDKESFEASVLVDPIVIESFRKYEADFTQSHNVPITDSFDISAPAVKKQSKVFKSVLKLDKNFHIYIHGNRELIEKGVDPSTGKKFYKIYFEEEN